MSSVIRFLLSVVCLIVLAGSANSQSEIGKAEVIVNQVSGSGIVGGRQINAADPVFKDEQIAAGEASHGELRLSDNSKILVGPNSSITLDEFVTGGQGFNSGTLRISRGALRFVSGRSSSGTFDVSTPLSTVGVRGTTFDVYVHEGEEFVVLYRGTVEVCTQTGRCKIANRSCDVIRTTGGNGINKLPYLKSRAASRSYNEQNFDLIFKQRRFNRRWRAPLYLCHSRNSRDLQQGGGEVGTENDNNNHGDDSHD